MKETTFFEDFKKMQIDLEVIGKNAKGYNYKYADLPQIWENIKVLLTSCNFIVYHQVTLEGVKTTAQHVSGEKLESIVPFSGSIKPQEKGSEITYFKRYNILALFNVIVDGEDDDAKSANDTVKQASGKYFNQTKDIKLSPALSKFNNEL